MLSLALVESTLQPSNSLLFRQECEKGQKVRRKVVKDDTNTAEDDNRFCPDQDNCTDIFEYGLLENSDTTYGFINSSEFSQPKKRYGLAGITRNGKKLIRESCHAIRRKRGVKRLGLLTVTLPGLPENQLRIVCSNWNWLIKLFKQKLSREQERRNCPLEKISVSEIQPKRLKDRNIPSSTEDNEAQTTEQEHLDIKKSVLP